MPSDIQLKRADCKLRESHTRYPASPDPLLQGIKLHLGHGQDERAVRGKAVDETLDHERLSRSGESLEVKVLINSDLKTRNARACWGARLKDFPAASTNLSVNGFKGLCMA